MDTQKQVARTSTFDIWLRGFQVNCKDSLDNPIPKLKPAICFFLGPPIITSPPKDISVLSGANVTFFCVGLGDPEPTLTWLKASETVRPSKRIAINDQMRSLQLFVVTVADAGKYTCVYKNMRL